MPGMKCPHCSYQMTNNPSGNNCPASAHRSGGGGFITCAKCKGKMCSRCGAKYG